MWIALALLCALSLALADALLKSALRNGAGAATLGWLRVALSVPFTLPILLFIQTPELDRVFWAALLIAMPFEMLAMVLYARALELSPMSLTLPFLSLTPVFLLVVGRLLLGESIPPMGVAGICLITAGGYALNFSHRRYGWLGPLMAIGRERGSLLMIAVALIFSITASLLKLAINHSSAMFYAALYYAALTAAAFPLGLPGLRRLKRADFWKLAVSGFLMALMLVTNMAALSLAPVAYVISIKRLSLVFGALLGFYIFREGEMGERLTGALMMLAGFAVVVLAGH